MIDEDKSTLAIIGVVVMGVTLLIAGGCWGIPKYKVYQQTLRGEASLREAEWTRKIAVEEAKAIKESAGLKAEAEVARAHGVAEANQIIGDSLKGNEAYLRYLWIDSLSSENVQTIYVPTEAGLPILEAGRRP